MDMVERGDMLSKDDVLDILAVDLIGIVPDDENIVISTNQGEPLVGSNTPAGKAYQNICNGQRRSIHGNHRTNFLSETCKRI